MCNRQKGKQYLSFHAVLMRNNNKNNNMYFLKQFCKLLHVYNVVPSLYNDTTCTRIQWGNQEGSLVGQITGPYGSK